MNFYDSDLDDNGVVNYNNSNDVEEIDIEEDDDLFLKDDNFIHYYDENAV